MSYCRDLVLKKLINYCLDLAKELRMSYCRDLVIKKLPDQNYVVLKFLVEFLSLVRTLKF